ncbi:MAG: NRDE family protein [Bacteroidetes bacterium]|nr:NRDE family protein [Bacteroidota bacterium]
MCTVTYIPEGENKFILTSSRDENINRGPSQRPQVRSVEGANVLYPKDVQGGGSWIASSDQGRSVCLINGALTNNSKDLTFKKSRGLVLLDSFGYETFEAFVRDYSLDGIAPFTMIVIETVPKLTLIEFLWNGRRKYLNYKDSSKPYIWSSVTLYNEETRKSRKKWFTDWLRSNLCCNAKSIFYLHRFGGKGDQENNYYMVREDGMRTVSITQLEHLDEEIEMRHRNFITDQLSLSAVKFNNNAKKENRNINNIGLA